MLRHWVALAALSWLGSGALYLTLPPSPDQFQHAYLGWRLLEGDIPYRDIIDVNWPGVMALHAVATWLFGANLWSWRAFDFTLFAASAFCLSDLVSRASGQAAGRLCLILAPVAYAGASYWVVGQHDMSAAQFLVAALWLHVRGYEKRACWFQIGTGLFIGLAMLNKPTIGIVGVLLPLQALWFRFPMRLVCRHTTAAGISALATLLIALAAVVARGTSLPELLDATYVYNAATQYSGDQAPAKMIGWLLQFHFQWIPMLTLGGAPAVAWILRRANRSMAATALLVLWAAGVLSYLIQWRGLTYHLAPCLIALIGCVAISAALVFTGRMNIGNAAWTRLFVGVVVCLSLLGIGTRLGASYRSLPVALVGGDYGAHLSRFSAADEVSFADIVTFVRHLETLPPKECVLLVGDASSINYLAQRRMPTRFYYYHVLMNAPPPLPIAQRWIELWEKDLRAANCRFALVSREVESSHWLSGSSKAAAALRQFLLRYSASGTIGAPAGITIYERK